MKGRDRILLDLDDTLYATPASEAAATAALIAAVSNALELPAEDVLRAWATARSSVKKRIDGRGSSHARLLYLAELVHALGRPDALVSVRTWERTYWHAFVGAAKVRPRARAFLESARRAGMKVAIVSDLTLEVQLFKLETFGVLPWIDALATSEEVPLDKPNEAIFLLAMDRLGTTADACIVVGDHDGKDGEGARRLKMPYFRIENDEEGHGFDAVMRELGLS